MDLYLILRKAWQMLWHYRALWLFGAVLAMFGANTVVPNRWNRWNDEGEWTSIRLSDTLTYRFPGIDLTIDLTAPEGIRFTSDEAGSWEELRQEIEQINRQESINLWAVMIELAVIAAILLLFGTAARYTAETALIRMVNESEESGKPLSVLQGLRKGWSRQAWRLFLLDFTVGLLGNLALLAAAVVSAAPILLAAGGSDPVVITAAVGSFGLFLLVIFLSLVAWLALSFVMQPIRRARVLEEQSMTASVRLGLSLIRHHRRDTSLMWVVWLGIRLMWVPVAVLIFILLFPLLLLTISVGSVLGGALSVLVAVISGLFISGVTPWILGAIAGVPILIIVMVSPMIFLSGLVETYTSSIWTLAYRDLRAMERPVKENMPTPQTPLIQAHGPAD